MQSGNYTRFSLIALTDAFMTRKRIRMPGNQFFNPSAASVAWEDMYGMQKVSGACLRQSWYRYMGVEGAKDNTAYSEWIFALGKAVEEILVEQWKMMGCWVANNVKFYDLERNLSGEIDVVISDPDNKLVTVEVKSFYGYMATKEICGSPKQVGKPKISQLLQTLIYVDMCKKYHIADYAKMIYYARDSAARAEFDIDLVEQNGVHYPTINGVIDYRFTLEDIYKRYEQLQYYLDTKQLPPRDYELVYSPEKMKQLGQTGQLSKTVWEAFQKNPKRKDAQAGDWECRYCPFTNICWSSSADVGIVDVEPEMLKFEL